MHDKHIEHKKHCDVSIFIDFPLEGTCSKSELWRSYCQPCQAAFVADAIRSYYIMLFRYP